VEERGGEPTTAPRRRRYITALVVGCLAVLALLAWLNRPRDEPARATVDDAVRSFRAQREGRSPDAGTEQRALGVYRYATRGWESVQNPILDTTHDYDGVSTIVLSAGACGEIERWQVLDGRWTEGESCPGRDGDRFTAGTEFHEFFGIEQEDSFRCRGFSMSGPPVERVGARFSSSCESDDSSVLSESRVVAFEAITVSGKVFPAIHTESRSRLEGASTGTARRQDWRRRFDGLLLKRVVSSEADTSLGGGTHYRERYAIELLDPRPRR
jgi:hypothetical protein